MAAKKERTVYQKLRSAYDLMEYLLEDNDGLPQSETLTDLLSVVTDLENGKITLKTQE